MNRSEYEDCGLLSIKQTDGLGLCPPEDLQTPREETPAPRKAPVDKKCPFKTVALPLKL